MPSKAPANEGLPGSPTEPSEGRKSTRASTRATTATGTRASTRHKAPSTAPAPAPTAATHTPATETVSAQQYAAAARSARDRPTSDLRSHSATATATHPDTADDRDEDELDEGAIDVDMDEDGHELELDHRHTDTHADSDPNFQLQLALVQAVMQNQNQNQNAAQVDAGGTAGDQDGGQHAGPVGFADDGSHEHEENGEGDDSAYADFSQQDGAGGGGAAAGSTYNTFGQETTSMRGGRPTRGKGSRGPRRLRGGPIPASILRLIPPDEPIPHPQPPSATPKSDPIQRSLTTGEVTAVPPGVLAGVLKMQADQVLARFFAKTREGGVLVLTKRDIPLFQAFDTFRLAHFGTDIFLSTQRLPPNLNPTGHPLPPNSPASIALRISNAVSFCHLLLAAAPPSVYELVAKEPPLHDQLSPLSPSSVVEAQGLLECAHEGWYKGIVPPSWVRIDDAMGGLPFGSSGQQHGPGQTEAGTTALKQSEDVRVRALELFADLKIQLHIAVLRTTLTGADTTSRIQNPFNTMGQFQHLIQTDEEDELDSPDRGDKGFGRVEYLERDVVSAETLLQQFVDEREAKCHEAGNSFEKLESLFPYATFVREMLDFIKFISTRVVVGTDTVVPLVKPDPARTATQNNETGHHQVDQEVAQNLVQMSQGRPQTGEGDMDLSNIDIRRIIDSHGPEFTSLLSHLPVPTAGASTSAAAATAAAVAQSDDLLNLDPALRQLEEQTRTQPQATSENAVADGGASKNANGSGQDDGMEEDDDDLAAELINRLPERDGDIIVGQPRDKGKGRAVDGPNGSDATHGTPPPKAEDVPQVFASPDSAWDTQFTFDIPQPSQDVQNLAHTQAGQEAFFKLWGDLDSNFSQFGGGSNKRKRQTNPDGSARKKRPKAEVPASPAVPPPAPTPKPPSINRYRLNRNMPDGRKPWRDEETDALEEGLKRYWNDSRCWMKIWKEHNGEPGSRDDVLKDRNQVALKDKARNMKNKIEREGKQLPHYLAVASRIGGTGDFATPQTQPSSKKRNRTGSLSAGGGVGMDGVEDSPSAHGRAGSYGAPREGDIAVPSAGHQIGMQALNM